MKLSLNQGQVQLHFFRVRFIVPSCTSSGLEVREHHYIVGRTTHTHTHTHTPSPHLADICGSWSTTFKHLPLTKIGQNPSGMQASKVFCPKMVMLSPGFGPQVRFDTIHELLIVNSNAFCRQPFPRFLRGSPYTYRILTRIKAILVGEIATFPNLFLLSWKYNNQAPWLELGLYQASSLVAAIVECLTGRDLDSWGPREKGPEGPWSFNDHL